MKYLEKTLYFGLGLITYSAEKVEEIVNDLVKRGEVASEDARNLVNDLMEKGEKQKEAVKKFVREETAKVMDNMDIAHKKDTITRDEIRQIIREELSRQQNPNS